MSGLWVILILFQVIQLVWLAAISKLLVTMQENDTARIKRFLENRGLVDLPMAKEGQFDYTDAERLRPKPRSRDLRFERDM